MSNVLSFKRKSVSPSRIIATKSKSAEEIFSDCLDEVMFDWSMAAEKNKLNEYFLSKIPFTEISSARELQNLNFLSEVEQKLKIRNSILSPNITKSNPYGWLASFQLGNKVFSAPPDMATESTARAVCILLFIKFSNSTANLVFS